MGRWFTFGNCKRTLGTSAWREPEVHKPPSNPHVLPLSLSFQRNHLQRLHFCEGSFHLGAGCCDSQSHKVEALSVHSFAAWPVRASSALVRFIAVSKVGISGNYVGSITRLAKMSQSACFRLLPQTMCAVQLGDKHSRKVGGDSRRSSNLLFQRSCVFTKKTVRIVKPLGQSLIRGKSRSDGRRLVVTNVTALERVPETAPYERICECLVYPSLDRTGKTKGIIHFLGGAFIGAAPDVIYSVLIELLAKEGFLIVATPYSLSFDHTVSAQGIHSRFNSCLDYMSNAGVAVLSAEEISTLPVYSVGHSLGALMQVLIGSTCSGKLPQASAIISFNNKPAADAVPFFEQMRPTLAQVAPIVESSPVTEFARAFSSEAIRAILDSRIPLPPAVGDNLQSVRQFLDQIPAVFDQVSQGVLEFTPTPAQNRETASISYAVPNNLLVKFTEDLIDETDTLEEILRPRSEQLGGRLKKVVLNGTHLTPVAPDVKWRAGREYTPADAVAQVLRNAALADLRGLARNIADWFSSL